MTMVTRYKNREAAGKILAAALNNYADHPDVIVLALPRGGVPVAYEIAAHLHVPLDVFVVRKIGVPGQSELAMGAIASGGVRVFNEGIIHHLKISQDAIKAVIANEEKELQRRNDIYRSNRPFPDLHNKTIILVDDGIATGASIRAAIGALRKLNPAQIIVAVPVADKDICDDLAPLVDGLICPLQPPYLNAVGSWYEEFTQTEDEEVYALLKKAATLAN